jgi:epoxyqueuosine reductase
VDPEQLLPGIRSIVAVALAHPAASAAEKDPPPGRARVARYAGGEDYHDVMLDRLRALASGMAALAGRDVRARAYVDTGPVLERAFAARAGLGWIGKNTCLIDRALGSRLMLGVVLSDLDLPVDPPETDHCGTCRACLDACPTDAFPEPYVLDATRCIAYTTIELRGPIPEPLRAGQGHWVFGCDVCQDVCPWNRRPDRDDRPDPLGLRARLEPDPRFVQAELGWILALDEPGYLALTRGTALRRARFRGLIRNALVAAGNSGDPTLRGAVERWAEGDDALLAEHAVWALARL